MGWFSRDLELMLMSATAPPKKGFVSFLPPSGDIQGGWVRKFEDGAAAGTGQSACMGVALAPPAIEPACHAFAGGWFVMDVDFGDSIVLQTDAFDDAFLAKIDRDAQKTRWVVPIGGAGVQRALAVAADPATSSAAMVAIAGYFNDELEIPSNPPLTTNGDEDAFVMLFTETGSPPQGVYAGHLRLGGLGHDRITAVAFDGAGGVIVAGFFSDPDMEFNPDGLASFKAASQAGGTDIFIARYTMAGAGHGAASEFELDWLHTTGTAGDDSGAALAVDSRLHVGAAGWKRSAQGDRDLWVIKITEPPSGPLSPRYVAIENIEWEHTYAGDGDDAGHGIAVDGLDRWLVTGQFGFERLPGGGQTPTYTLDFDPGTGTDRLTTAGGLDLFVMRLLPDGDQGTPIYDWAFTIGGEYNEVGSSVAADPVLTTRAAHAGWFGDPDAPGGYTIDFDPGTGTTNGSTSGKTDGFVSTFLPTIPAGVIAQVSLALDNSTSILQDEYQQMLGVLRDLLADPAVVHQDGTVAINAVMFGSGGSIGEAQQVMPWTVFTPETAVLFGNKLAGMVRPTEGGTYIDSGLYESHLSQVGDGIISCYKSILVIADGENRFEEFDQSGAMRAARDYVLDTEDPLTDLDVHQVNALAVRGDALAYWNEFMGKGRQYMVNFVIGSDAAVNNQAYGLGLALETPNVSPDPNTQFSDPMYPILLERLLRRSTRCPGDFDRDGDVDQNDKDEFLIAYAMANPASDWNFDGVVDSMDWATFLVAWDLGCCQ